jgi:DNA topoisomerase I
MAYELIICEKPQAANKIASALADKVPSKQSVNKVPYYELTHNGKDIVVAAAVGHLFNLAEKNKGKWTYPVYDIEWKPASEIQKGHFSKKYHDVLVKLSKKAKEFTVATDYDVEGEVIGLNIVRSICKQKDANRMKFSTLTKKDIVDAYENKSKHLDWGQANAGEARHILDWYWGINLSRALTLAVKKAKGGFKLLSAGRVQGPALKLVVDKEKEIKAFKSEPYWQLRAIIDKNKAKLESWHEKDKFWDKKEVDKIYSKVKDEREGEISDIQTRSFKHNPPVPFDLTTLQTEAHKTCGISPKETQAIGQNLYTQGFISYPRTSSQKLPAKIGFPDILTKLKRNPEYKELASKLLSLKKLVPNEGKKTDDAHPSIFPTGNIPDKITPREAKVYDLIVRRFMSVFGEPATRETMKVSIDVSGENFILEGTRTKEKGWHIFYAHFLRIDEVELPSFDKGEKVKISKIENLSKETQPPKRFSESSIIRALEKANLGTKATRANIIDTLVNRGYIKGKSIEATPLGIQTVETLEKYSPRIVDEELTRSFESEMDTIRKDSKKEQKVIDKAKETLNEILEDFKKKEDKIGANLKDAERDSYQIANYVGKCECGGDLMIRKSKFGKFVGCLKYPECKKTFSLPKTGIIKPLGEVCAECQHPVLSVKAIRGKMSKVCINPKCVTWTKEYQEKLKNEESNK